MSVRILIIDDDHQDRTAMGLALEKEGYQDIHFAQTGEEGISKAKELKPDVVLLDVVLNEVDGFDICQQMRHIEDFSSKIIMVTGHLDAVDAQKARDSHADEIVEKEPGFKNIHTMIQSVL